MSAQLTRAYSPAPPVRDAIVLPAFRARHAARPGRLTLRYSRSAFDGRPVVVVLGGISANADIIARSDGTPGWWSTQAGAGRAIDTARFNVLGMDYVTGSAIAGADCEHITTTDQADALAALLNALHISRLHAVIGASYGAMVGLAFAAMYPERLARLVALSGAHEAHPRATALRSIQRQIIELAQTAGRPADGVALARGLAIVGYRDHATFAARFGVAPQRAATGFRFSVEGYLAHQGRKYAAQTGADDYRQLSESLDLHTVAPETITTPVTLVAADPDFLVPFTQLQELTERLAGPARLHILRSTFGHDAFLKEDAQVTAVLREALAGEATV